MTTFHSLAHKALGRHFTSPVPALEPADLAFTGIEARPATISRTLGFKGPVIFIGSTPSSFATARWGSRELYAGAIPRAFNEISRANRSTSDSDSFWNARLQEEALLTIDFANSRELARRLATSGHDTTPANDLLEHIQFFS